MAETPVMSAAREAMARGWAVFPVKRDKTPATLHGLKEARKDPAILPTWYELHPDRGVALATGNASGVFAVDLDGPDAVDRFRWLQKELGDVPETVVSKTARGYHLLFRMPEDGDVRNSAGKIAEGVDVRGTGGYIVLPPSPHPSGTCYRWAAGRSPAEIEVADAPNWLLEIIQAPSTSESALAPAIDAEIPAGQRDATLTSLAGTMRRRGMGEAEILAALTVSNSQRCVPPLAPADLERIARSVSRYEPAVSPVVSAKPQPMERKPPLLEVIDRAVLDRIRDEKLQPLSVVPTPWPTWNCVCRGAGGGQGLAHGWHVIIGAASGSGKSLAATNLAYHAVRAGEHVCFLSLEMSQAEVVTRLLSIYANVDARKLEHGPQFDRVAWEAAAEGLGEAEGSIRVNSEPLHSLRDIATAIEAYAAQGCRVMIVDYLQLAWVQNAETMHTQIMEVSHTIRGLARQHRLLSVGLSQVNRQQSFGGGELRKEGLLGGSSLENDADQVVLIGKPTPSGRDYVSEVKLDKNRHGPPVEWSIMLEARTLRMREMALDELPAREVA